MKIQSINRKLVALLLVGCILPFASALAEDLSDRVSQSFDTIKIGAHSLEVTNWQSQVTVEGWVSSEQDRDLVLQTARAVNGVDEVVDKLAINPVSGQGRASLDDGRLLQSRLDDVKANTESYLNGAKLKGPHSLEYEMSDQGIIIRGELPAGAEKQALFYHLKRNIDAPIIDQIKVRAWPTDAELSSRLRADLQGKQGIDLSGIGITSKDGVVGLTGHRRNHHEADRINAATLMVEGVRDVKSTITFDGSRYDP